MNPGIILFFLFTPLLLLQFNLDPALAKNIYKVQKGDTLYNLALKHDTSVNKLKELNNLKNNNLNIGQTLVIDNSPAPESAGIIYKVASGDTLSEIADRYGMSSRDLVRANNLSDTNLSIGQEIRIPKTTKIEGISLPPASVAREAAVNEQRETSGNHHHNTAESLYTVKSGDTLSQIAERHGITTDRLRNFNSISGNTIKAGQEIRIPSSNTVFTENRNDEPQNQRNISETPGSYKVVSGDTLSQIAEKFNTSTKALREANNINGNIIRQGQQLLIPGISSGVSPGQSGQHVGNHNDSYNSQDLSDYRVQSGDTLSGLAVRFETTTDNLKKINNLNSANLIAGRIIKVPGKAANNGTSSAETFSYKIKKGDTLYTLARKYGTSVDVIKQVNGLRSSNLSIGKAITIPGKDYEVSSPAADSEPVIYKIRKGDTLGNIARKFGVSISSIRQTNNIRGNNIIAGTTLRIPARGLKTIDYRVRRGDSLSYIARTHGSRVDLIKKANNLKGSSIYTGQVLSVPVVNSGTTPNSYAAGNTGISNKIISVAKKYLGAPYKFGGTSTRTGIDCSAYVNKVFKSFNVHLPRTARDIYKEGEWVDRNELRKGDLVFFTTYAKFPSHVGIYMGDDKFIHASSAAKKVTITNLNRRYYQKRFIGAKRIPLEGLFYEQYSKEFDDSGKNFN